MRILLVEDNARLSALIGEALRKNGFAVDAVAIAANAEAAIGSIRYDAMVLDLGLPDRDGMTLLAPARRQNAAMPILGACLISHWSSGCESDSKRGYEQAFSPLED
jgi:DNA-binding response OmpR family regulator